LDFVGATVAILFSRLDAEQVVRGDLVQDAIECVFAASDLHPEERAAGRARKLIEPAAEHLAVARLALQVLVAFLHLRREAIYRTGVEVEGIDGCVRAG